MNSEQAEEKPNFKVPNLERALQILEFMVQREDELSQREIAVTMDCPVNSVMRILNALEYYGYLNRNPANKKYSLSNKLSSMGRSSANRQTLMEAILAFIPEAECEQVLQNVSFEKLTPATITSIGAFREELAQVREDCFALDRAEAIEGVFCVAAPILDHTGNSVAAITATGPASRMHLKDLPGIGKTIQLHTERISRRLGAPVHI